MASDFNVYVIAACGVCHSDLHVMKGELPFASPCVVGHEITGEVAEHGPLTDSKIIERCSHIYRLERPSGSVYKSHIIT